MPDGGYFDQLDSDSQWLDPRKMAWSGWAQGFGQAAMPTRMPTPIGAVLGMGAGAANQAANEAFKNQLMRAQARGAGAEAGLNELSLNAYRAQQRRMGMLPPNAASAIASTMPGGGGTSQPPDVATAALATGGGPTAANALLMRQLTQRGAPAPSAGAPAGAPTAYGNQPRPLFDVADLKSQYEMAAANPRQAAIAQQLLSLIEKGTPEGSYMAEDGSIQSRPGYQSYLQNKSGSEAAGAFPYKAAESLLSRAGTPIRLEPGDSVTTGFAQIDPRVQEMFLRALTGRGGPAGTAAAAPSAAPMPTLTPGPDGVYRPAPAAPSPISPGVGTTPGAPARGQPGVDATGFPTQSIHGQEGTTQAPLTLQGATLQKEVLPAQFKEAGVQYQNAQGVMGSLNMIDHDLESLNSTGWSSTGPGENFKMSMVRYLNTAAKTFGLDDSISPEVAGKIATWESFNKESTRMGFALARSLGSREAMMIVQQAISAVPNAENTYLGARLVSSSLRQAAQRQMDYYEHLQNWATSHGGGTFGADVAFNKAHPVSDYTNRAVVNAVPPPAVDMLKAHPETAKQFDATFGSGTSKLILGKPAAAAKPPATAATPTIVPLKTSPGQLQAPQ